MGWLRARNVVDALDDVQQRHGLRQGQVLALAQTGMGQVAWQESIAAPADIRTLPAVAGAVRLIASTIDQLPLTVTRGEVPRWLARPKAYGAALDQGDLIQYLIDSMVVHGRAFIAATCRAAGDDPSFRLDAVDPGYVQPLLDVAEGPVRLRFLMQGEPVELPPAELGSCVKGATYLLHIPYRVSVDRPEGTTPLVEAAHTLRGQVTLERYASELFDNGTHLGGTLRTEADLDPEQAVVWRDSWMEARKQRKVAVLGNGLSYHNELADPNELQLVEARSFNQSVVWAMLGIPQAYMGASLMGGQSSLSYANAQDNRRQFADNCLRAFTTQIEDALSQLLPHGRTPAEDTAALFDYTEWEGRADEPQTDDMG